ncbi:MAG: hypothetical protein CMC22_01155 [Flavobacteriaceae bacterium]|nr:hypothetical protein [Flavobacteriaceae bacterium]
MRTPILYIFFTIFLLKINAQSKFQFQKINPKMNSLTFERIESDDIETQQMVELLKKINSEGNPQMYYHWNKKLAEYYKKKLSQSPKKDNFKIWLNFCHQLLLSGENQLCIDEIEKKIKKDKLSYNTLLLVALPVMEILGLAYLRLGEQVNCTNNHNEFSCILPLVEKGQHDSKVGSRKAIEIFSRIHRMYPNQNYKWLLNLAHMTLGDYPENVPKDYLIDYYKNIKDKSITPFREIASKLGIDVNGLSGGVSLEDFNNDGRIDIFTTSYGMEDQCKLFFNTGYGFEDVTMKAGLNGIVSGLNCLHADYNNDGYVDILILRGAWLGTSGNHPNSLLRNNGDGTFSDVSKSSGILSFYPTQTASWADVNNDGYLDLFIGNESKPNQHNPCELFINQGNGKFLEQSKKYNLDQINGFVKGVAFGDINNDQWPDLFVSVLGGKNFLFKNEFGTFNDISKNAGIEAPYYSFPCWIWDVNNDGYNDIFVASYDSRNLINLATDFLREIEGKNVDSEKSKLFINNGDETFTESSVDFNIHISMYAMGSNFGDIDNDGWLDFYIGNGSPELTSTIPNRMFRNLDGNKFEEVTLAGRFGHIQKGHGVGFADLDNDGDQDIYAVMGGAYEGDTYPNVCFENPSSKNNWVVLKLIGESSNRSAIGSFIKIELDNGRKIYRTINTGGSFGSSSLQSEIGLGNCKSIKKISINWPSGKIQVFTNLEPNKKYEIFENNNNPYQSQFNKLLFAKNFNHSHH